MVYKLLHKRSAATHTGTGNKSEKQQLAEELHKPIITKFEKPELYSSFKYNIWSADLAGMLLISKYNKKT